MGPKTHLVLQGVFFLIANFVIIIIIFKVEKRVVHMGSIFFFFLEFMSQAVVVLNIQLNDLIHHSI